jgi:hypothetical protein
VNQSKTLAIIMTVSAIAAGPAAAQVRCTVPAAKVTMPPTQNADTGESLIITSFYDTKKVRGCVALTDLQGVPSWSYCKKGVHEFMTRAVPGGTLLLIANKSFNDYAVREMNLAGTTINSITQAAANAQLATLGRQSIIDFNHEAMRLPNGYTALIAHNEALYTNVQGGTPQDPVDIMGDEVLVLDANWKIVWTWNAFDCPNCATALPVSRTAILNKVCPACAQSNSGGCCPVTLAPQANDWLHGNSLAYDSTDGNLIMSLRDQDWVIKLAFENGQGDGHIVWRLGNQGDFDMINTPNIPSPWFSQQHDVEVWVGYNPKLITLFDDGDTRHASDPTAVSRGQVLSIDETALTVDIYANVNFPFYSSAYGTSQILDNGNYWWQAGTAPGTYKTRSFEYLPSGYSGIEAYSIEFADSAYRSFRLDSASGF